MASHFTVQTRGLRTAYTPLHHLSLHPPSLCPQLLPPSPRSLCFCCTGLAVSGTIWLSPASGPLRPSANGNAPPPHIDNSACLPPFGFFFFFFFCPNQNHFLYSNCLHFLLCSRWEDWGQSKKLKFSRFDEERGQRLNPYK